MDDAGLPPLPDDLLELRGRSLREVRSDLVRQDTGMRCRWWQGQSGTDVFAWWRMGGDALEHVQLTFEHRVVDVDRGVLRVGVLRPDTEGTGYATRFDEWETVGEGPLRVEIVRQARRLLDVAEGLPADVRAALQGALAA